jgi:RNA-binding protein PNO1
MERDIDIDISDKIETGQEELMTVDVPNITNTETTEKVKQEYRKVLVPTNRMKPLKENWTTIVKALVEHMKIQVKMNTKLKCVEMRSYEKTDNTSALQKSEEFLKAYMCGFELQDAIAMLRLEDIYLETFEVKDGILC